MGSVTNRTVLTSRGKLSYAAWTNSDCTHSILQILLGNNPLSKVEIVSSLNSFNLAYYHYHFNTGSCASKYNPKVYLGTIQTASVAWNSDDNLSAQNAEKSGSWPQNYNHSSNNILKKDNSSVALNLSSKIIFFSENHRKCEKTTIRIPRKCEKSTIKWHRKCEKSTK